MMSSSQVIRHTRLLFAHIIYPCQYPSYRISIKTMMQFTQVILTLLIFQPSLGNGLIQKNPRYQHRRGVRNENGTLQQMQNPSANLLGLNRQITLKRSNRYNYNSKADSNDEHPYSADATTSTSSGNKSLLAKSAGIYLTSTIALAKLGILGEGYTYASIAQDTGITLLTSVAALIFVKVITKLAADGVLEARDSRKIIHTLSAPLFMLCWPLFSHEIGARFFAAFVPALQALRLYLAGTSSDDNGMNELSNAISRSGEKEEVLGGPFIYVVVLFSAVMLCFTDSLSGVIALSTMAAGDGMADIIGRRFGKNNKWFFCKSKSIAGSLAFIVASSFCSIGLASWLIYTHAIVVALPMGSLVSRILFISVVSALVELFPVGDDNWSVPIAAGALSSILVY